MTTNLAELDHPVLDELTDDDSAIAVSRDRAHDRTNGDRTNGDRMEADEPVRFPELSQELERDLVQVFKLLSDETRLRILMYLIRERELHVSALCERLGQSQPAVSHHLALLRVAGLIEARREGKHNFYSVKKSHFHRIMEELFQRISDPHTEEVRFKDFVLTQE